MDATLKQTKQTLGWSGKLCPLTAHQVESATFVICICLVRMSNAIQSQQLLNGSINLSVQPHALFEQHY